MITHFHAKYYAYELTAKRSSTSVERIATSLFDAHVDLNPHQIEAALFALRSPLSKGVILADEVGLGKTIEAGILLCQYWAEHKRQLLVICPASLRRQWSIELEEKFNLPSIILENDTYKTRRKSKDEHPLQYEGVVIMSYQFANRLKDEMRKVAWDLIVIDEAHKLRNLYRTDNKMGKNIQAALEGFKKVLLTATPLQNSLMELYGLASLIDDRLFGSVVSFRHRYVSSDPPLTELKARMKPFVHRTLRSQVLEYINYTRREAITQPFTPTEKEQELYDRVSDFLLAQDTYAIPWAQRKLVVLIIRKLMASSAFALVGTLQTIKTRLEDIKRTGKEKALNLRRQIGDNDMDADYLEDAEEVPTHKGRPIDFQKLEYEIQQVQEFETLARSIKIESKAKELLKALDIGFARMQELGAKRKVLIFTESRRTQRYLKEFLSENGFKDKIVTFNGQNNDELARSIYRKWTAQEKDTGRITGTLNVDMRMALVDFFRDEGEIMIATEAAAEGINLQFCSLLVNYDLPWNPQRVEQRIGRVHRYGQKHDVVVINFLNAKNWADQRIYQLLKEKFQLFDGVFGVSDEILGRIESGVDFEKRIYDIYDTCRKPEEIEQAFADLQTELEAPIQEKLTEARQMLFEHFDEDVHGRLKLRMENTKKRLDDVTRMFWELTKYIYLTQYNDSTARHKPHYYFNDETLIFGTDEEFIRHGARPEDHNDVPIYYYLDMDEPSKAEREAEDKALAKRNRARERGRPIENPRQGTPHRLSNIEGEIVLRSGKQLAPPPATITFHLSAYPHRIALLEDYVGKSGWLSLHRLTLETFEEVEHLLFIIHDEEGTVLGQEVGEKLFLLPATLTDGLYQENPYQDYAEALVTTRADELRKTAELDNHTYFNEELDKLDHWAEDLKNGLELELKKIDKDIRELDRQSKQMLSLQEKLEFQKQKAALEKRRNKKRHELYNSQDEIDKKRDTLIEQIEKQMRDTRFTTEELFRVQWSLR